MNNLDRLDFVDADILRADKSTKIKEDCVHISVKLNGVFQTVLISKQHIYDAIVQAQIRRSLPASDVAKAIDQAKETQE